jgi:hypothetical protein
VGFAAVAVAGPRGGLRRELCSLAKVIRVLSDEDAAGLQVMLDIDSGWTHAAIAEAMRAEGHRVAPETIGRHRRGACRCDAR